MVKISVDEFRSDMNTFLQKVEAGEIISLVADGTEVAQLIPPSYSRQIAREELRILRKSAMVGDVLSPIDESWQVM